jgi:hypothetical protein
MLESIHEPRISVTDTSGREIEDVLVHERIIEEEGHTHIYFLANTSRIERYHAIVRTPVVGRIREWGLETGETATLAGLEDEETEIHVNLPPTGSFAFSVETQKSPAKKSNHVCEHQTASDFEKGEQLAELAGPWNYRRIHPNSITLDFCEYRIGNSSWQGPAPVWIVRKEAKITAGMTEYEGLQPWLFEKKKIKPKAVRIQTQFRLKSLLAKPEKAWLVVEKAKLYKIKVNKKTVSTNTTRWHWDRQFTKLDIAEYLKKGTNLIELSCRYSQDTEIEDIYVIGDFGVVSIDDNMYALSEEPGQLNVGSWVEQGYPFYAGSMIYKAKVRLSKPSRKKIYVRLSDPCGAMFRIGLNGREKKPLLWQSAEGWQVEVTDQVKRGSNTIEVEVVGTLRNTFGPLHHKAGDNLIWTGPAEFTDEANWTNDYKFATYGLFGPLQIIAL